MKAIAFGFVHGVMTQNEGRRRLNLPPSTEAEADQLHMPTNNLTPQGDPGLGDSTADVVKSHLLRAAVRLRDKGYLDVPRFRRELATDTDDLVAAMWADRVQSAVSDGDVRALIAE